MRNFKSTFSGATCTAKTQISDKTGAPVTRYDSAPVPSTVPQLSKRRSAAGPQHVMMLGQAEISDADLLKSNTKLSELYKVFADAAAEADSRLGILAQRIDILQRNFRRLRISLQHTNKPFEGHVGFQKTLSACEIFIQCFKPPSNPGPRQTWLCSDSQIRMSDAEIMAEISLITTSIIVLLADTFFSNDDREPGATTKMSQSNTTWRIQPATDPELEQLEKFWEKITRLVYARKRKPLEPLQSTGPTDPLEVEVRNILHRLLLNNAKLIPRAAILSEPQDLQGSKDLNLEKLSIEKLLEINQQQERFGRTAFGRRPPPSANQHEPQDSFAPTLAGRVYTLPNDYESDVPPLSPVIKPKLQEGIITINNDNTYNLSSIECKLIDKKRTVKCITSDSPPFVILHELPHRTRRYPITIHPKMREQGSPDVLFSEKLDVMINSINISKASIKYNFIQSGSLKLFQSMVREKDLIETFSPDEIKSALHHIESSVEDLKIWKDHRSGEYTFSFYRNGLREKQQLECLLSSFEIKPRQQPNNSKIVRLDFVGEAPQIQRRSSHDSHALVSPNYMKKRNSVISVETTNSADKAAILAKAREQMRKTAASVEFLSIQFSTTKEANGFKTSWKKAHDDTSKDFSFAFGSEGPSSPNPRPGRRTSRANSFPLVGSPLDFQVSVMGAQYEHPGTQFEQMGTQFEDVPAGLPGLGISGVLPLSSSLPDPFRELLSIKTSEPTSASDSKDMIFAKDIQRSFLDYKVGWICALPLELAAAMSMLDEIHPPLPKHTYAADSNHYEVGRIGQHNVVITCLPSGMMGNTSATAVAMNMRFTFTNITTRLLVGIGGGVPSTANSIQLGDVVVSIPGHKNGGIVQHDYGKITSRGFQRTSQLPSPPEPLLKAVSYLQAKHYRRPNLVAKILGACLGEDGREIFPRPAPETDELFQADYIHVDDDKPCVNCCDRAYLQPRPDLRAVSVVHYGTIASGNSVVKDAKTRDELGKEHGVLCFEMEAAGLMREFQCLVIRGICDYSDTHKNKRWQPYAAAAAAAFAKELLMNIPA